MHFKRNFNLYNRQLQAAQTVLLALSIHIFFLHNLDKSLDLPLHTQQIKFKLMLTVEERLRGNSYAPPSFFFQTTNDGNHFPTIRDDGGFHLYSLVCGHKF